MHSNESPSGAFKRQSGLRKQMEGRCPDKLCGALQTLFHERSCDGKMHLISATFLVKIITPRENAGFAERPHRGHNTSRA